MIGLGSNRLTVCRRGGMSVTQAGRGGMEWLAGGRKPSWASPYSAAATAALKAQFPTQWPTIKAYGFAHPEIVGYMNAYAPEDAKIAYSLVEGIGTRWLVGDGTGRFDLGTPITYEDKMDIVFSPGNITDRFIGLWGASDSYSSNNRIDAIIYASGLQMYQGVGAGQQFSYYLTRDAEYKLSYDNGTAKLISGGTELVSGYIAKPSATYTRNAYLFCINRSGVTNFVGKISSAIGTLNGTAKQFVPFKRNGVMELLDLVSGNLATRVGTFTELIESPS